MKILAILCFALAIIGLNAERHLVCERLDSVSSEDDREEEDLPQTSNSEEAVVGRKGEKGNAGVVGLPGPPGRLADVDFRIVNASIERKLNVIQSLSEKVEELSSKLKELRRRMKPKVNPQGICELWFPGKCYWAHVPERFSMSLREGDAICRKKSGHLANLYNAEEYSKIIAYLQEKTPPDLDWMSVHLGMEVDPENRLVRFRNGTRATFLPWYPTYPVFKPPFTKIHMTVTSEDSPLYYLNETTLRMGIHDFDPLFRARSTLCEISTAD